jgi:hypothetical protein
MRFDEIMRGAEMALENREYDQATAQALVAIATCLDRLCEMASQGRGKHF